MTTFYDCFSKNLHLFLVFGKIMSIANHCLRNNHSICSITMDSFNNHFKKDNKIKVVTWLTPFIIVMSYDHDGQAPYGCKSRIAYISLLWLSSILLVNTKCYNQTKEIYSRKSEAFAEIAKQIQYLIKHCRFIAWTFLVTVLPRLNRDLPHLCDVPFQLQLGLLSG